MRRIRDVPISLALWRWSQYAKEYRVYKLCLKFVTWNRDIPYTQRGKDNYLTLFHPQNTRNMIVWSLDKSQLKTTYLRVVGLEEIWSAQQ